MNEEMDQNWQALSQEILLGMKAWRLAHPKATLREIEQEVNARMDRLGAQLVQDAAQASSTSEWTTQPVSERPRCSECGTPLVSRGQRSRRLQSRGGQSVELTRTYGVCPTCGVGLFPPGP